MDARDELRAAAAALLSDINGLYAGEDAGDADGDAGEAWFGSFSEWEVHDDGTASISWPNLRISADRLREALGLADGT